MAERVRPSILRMREAEKLAEIAARRPGLAADLAEIFPGWRFDGGKARSTRPMEDDIRGSSVRPRRGQRVILRLAAGNDYGGETELEATIMDVLAAADVPADNFRGGFRVSLVAYPPEPDRSFLRDNVLHASDAEDGEECWIEAPGSMLGT